MKSRLARAAWQGTREEAIRMRMDQSVVTNARRDIGIMKVPSKVSPDAQRSRALRTRTAPARMQEAARKARAVPSTAAPVSESHGSALVLQHASADQLQRSDDSSTVPVPAMPTDMSPTRDALDMVVPPAVGDLAPGNESAPAQQAAVSEPRSQPAAAPPPDLALLEAPPAALASSAPHSQLESLQGRIACWRVARRTEPCTEEASVLEAPLPVPGGAAPCDEIITGALGRLKRVPGGDPLQV